MSSGSGSQSHHISTAAVAGRGRHSTYIRQFGSGVNNPPIGYVPTSPFMNNGGGLVNNGGMVNGPQYMDPGRNVYFPPHAVVAAAAAATTIAARTPGMGPNGIGVRVPTPIYASLPPPMNVHKIAGGQQVGPLADTGGEIIYPEELNVFVKNLDDSFDVEKLAKVFGACGNIVSAKVETLANGVSKGFGFVCFRTAEEANQAIREFNGKIVGTKPLYVSHFQPKAKRQAMLKAKREEMLSRQRSDGHEPNGNEEFK